MLELHEEDGLDVDNCAGSELERTKATRERWGPTLALDERFIGDMSLGGLKIPGDYLATRQEG